MTKKDYELIASCLNVKMPLSIDNNGNNPYTYWLNTCNVFTETLASKNPRFDKDKFLQACGVVSFHDCRDCNNNTTCSNCKK